MINSEMFKKSLLTFLASIILTMSILPLFSRPVQAQTWYNQPFNEWYVKVYDTDNPEEIFGERYTAAQVEWVFYGFVSFVMNMFLGPELTVCLIEPRSGIIPEPVQIIADCAGEIKAFAEKWLSPLSSNTISNEGRFLATITSSPVSGVAYFKDIAEKLHIVPEAKAQGFGFSATQPVLGLWRFVRNVTYFLLILVLVVMAFMIMFRVKISPQTVITVQSALPKVILALILITFSYAIAGLLIDLMYVVMGLLAAIFSGSELSNLDWPKMFEAIAERGIFELLYSYLLLFGISLIPALLFGGIINATLGLFFVPLIYVLVFIILIFVFLRIFWLMLKTYVMILLYIIIGPILILLGTFSQGGFGSWLRGILAHLAVYPTVAFMFVLAFVFLRAAWPQEIPDLIQDIIT